MGPIVRAYHLHTFCNLFDYHYWALWVIHAPPEFYKSLFFYENALISVCMGDPLAFSRVFDNNLLYLLSKHAFRTLRMH